MIWSSWSEFIEMGGYAGFVWWSYGVTVVFMVGEVVLLNKRKRTIIQRLGRFIRADRSKRNAK
jgi:heme exporter protein D